MSKTLAVGLLAGLLLLPSCAPAFQVGGQSVQVVGGTAFRLVKQVDGDALTPEALAAVPPDTYLTFAGCRGAGVAAGDVRAVGLEAAREACVRAVTQARQAEEALGVARVLFFPFGVAAAAALIWLLRILTFQT